MTYQSFLDEIQKLIHLALPEGIVTTYQTVQKNNGVNQIGICFSRESEENVTPVIYMEPFFQAFENGETMEDLAKKIAGGLLKPIPEMLQTKAFINRDYILSHVVFRLISKSANANILPGLAYRDFLDLALSYGIVVNTGGEDRGIMPVQKNLLEKCGLEETDIYEAALRNAEKLSGDVCEPMEDFMEIPRGGTPMMYVLTNNHCFFGAAAIVYSKKIRELSNRLESDLFVIPSSIHELLLVRRSPDEDHEKILKIIREVNCRYVSESEQLSNHLYIYSRETGECRVVGE